MGFGRVGGSNFGLLHWLASSPLQYSARVCNGNAFSSFCSKFYSVTCDSAANALLRLILIKKSTPCHRFSDFCGSELLANRSVVRVHLLEWSIFWWSAMAPAHSRATCSNYWTAKQQFLIGANFSLPISRRDAYQWLSPQRLGRRRREWRRSSPCLVACTSVHTSSDNAKRFVKLCPQQLADVELAESCLSKVFGATVYFVFNENITLSKN